MSGTKLAFITGTARGLGLALARQLLDDGWNVTGTVRGEATPCHALANQYPGRVSLIVVDMLDDDCIETIAARTVGQEYDLVMLNAGVSPAAAQDVMALDPAVVTATMMINSIVPIRIATAMLPKLRRHSGVVAFMSSRLGVVSLFSGLDEELYGVSKAALNLYSRSFAARLDPADGLTVLTLTPGWVSTDMGGPDATVSPKESAQGMAAVIKAAAGRGDHQFLAYDGSVVPW